MATAAPEQATHLRNSLDFAGVRDLYSALVLRVERYPGAPMVGGQDGLRWRTIASREFLERVNGLAQRLASGTPAVTAGGRVVLWLPHHWWTPIYLFALWRLGAVAVPFDREMNVDAARKILTQVEPKVVLSGLGTPPWAGEVPVLGWFEPPPGRCELPPPDLGPADGLAAIYFTSGTTGTPKGCQIGHDNLLYQVNVLPSLLAAGPDCRLASILPLSHLFELTVGLLYVVLHGAAVHYVPSRRGDDIVRVLQEQRITHMLVVPQLLAAMGTAAEQRLKAALPGWLYGALLAIAAQSPMPARRLLFRSVHQRLGGQLRYLISGGAALPPDVQRFWELLGVRTLQGYGASECSPVVAGGKADGSAPYGSVGTPLPGTEVRRTDQGELLVRGPGVFRGYWCDPERTREVLSPDGWYATGDLTRIDQHGNIFIEGRAKDLLVLPSGMKVWPDDVEAALKAQPGIKDAVVILARHASIHAYLLPSGTTEQTLLERAVASANGRLAQHQRVASASWWPDDDFPRTALGKVRRQLLPLPEQASAPAISVDATRAADDPVLASVAAVAGRAGVSETETLAALGLDSLTLSNLALTIEEKTGIALSDGALRPDMTVAEVRATVSQIGAGTLPGESLAVVDEDGRPLVRRAEVEAAAWTPPLWLYTRGRALRRLSWPVTLLHRHYVPRVHVRGAEQLEALPDSVIFASTHRSFADLPTLQRALRESPARQRWNRLVVAAAGGILADAGLLGRLVIAAYGLFPLRQYSGREASLRQLARILDAGNSLVLFPQGRHTLPQEEQELAPMARFKPGVAHLARELELPVVPVGLAGDERVIPGRVPPGFRGLVIAGIPVRLHRQDVAVIFGRPLVPLEDESAQAFSERIEAAAFALAREAEAMLSGA